MLPISFTLYFVALMIRDGLPAGEQPWRDTRTRLYQCDPADITYTMPPHVKADFYRELFERAPLWEIYGGRPDLKPACLEKVRLAWLKSRSSSFDTSLLLAGLGLTATVAPYGAVRALGWIVDGFATPKR